MSKVWKIKDLVYANRQVTFPDGHVVQFADQYAEVPEKYLEFFRKSDFNIHTSTEVVEGEVVAETAAAETEVEAVQEHEVVEEAKAEEVAAESTDEVEEVEAKADEAAETAEEEVVEQKATAEEKVKEDE